jgi:HlyD family secretion protein
MSGRGVAPNVVAPREAVRAPTEPQPSRRPWPALLLTLLLGAATLAGFWRLYQQNAIPRGIVRASGRVEVHEIPVTAAVSAPVSEVVVAEGDSVSEGQVLARLDLEQPHANLERADALVGQTRLALEAAQSEVAQRRNQFQVADNELKRWQSRAVVTKAQIDQRQAARDAAQTVLNAAAADEAAATEANEVAKKDVERLRSRLNEDRIVAPKAGRVQYRLVDPGESLHPGSVIATLLDPDDITIAVDVSPAEAGRIRIGDEARVLVDDSRGAPITATVTFVGPQPKAAAPAAASSDANQSASKLAAGEAAGGAAGEAREAVEGTVRVRLHVDRSLVQGLGGEIRTGIPATAYIRTAGASDWPAALRTR